ncbi:MAG: RimK family alpha-L-glutamate ligase [Candidatus Bathyarchaeota archaeon]|nr:MAG: RimK family alpha-L-glutamate ligase [Candidatus Bathyarchaeota archaeon]
MVRDAVLKMGIVTRNENGWDITQLIRAMERRNVTPMCFSFPKIVARIKHKTKASVGKTDILGDLHALVIRPIGRGSLEEIIFRMDLLHRLERLGMLIINPPLSIERSVDKYHALTLLEEHGLPVPRTAVTENPDDALKSFYEMGEDVVIKPLFGSRGIGSTRVSDPEVATRVFRAVSFHHGVLYIQQFVPHGNSDIRALVLGDHVVASMRRVADNWKTNVSLGAKPVAFKLDKEMENLAVKAAKVIGCRAAGVDILEGPEGPLIVELNSQPGWKGLQSVTTINIADKIIHYVLSELKA